MGLKQRFSFEVRKHIITDLLFIILAKRLLHTHQQTTVIGFSYSKQRIFYLLAFVVRDFVQKSPTQYLLHSTPKNQLKTQKTPTKALDNC